MSGNSFNSPIGRQTTRSIRPRGPRVKLFCLGKAMTHPSATRAGRGESQRILMREIRGREDTCLSEPIRFGPNRIISDQDFCLMRLALYFSIAFFNVASSSGSSRGSHSRMSDFKLCRGQSPGSGTPAGKCSLKYFRMRGCLPTARDATAPVLGLTTLTFVSVGTSVGVLEESVHHEGEGS